MARLYFRKLEHSQAPNNYRAVLKSEHEGEIEIGSIGVQAFASRDVAWTWGIDTVVPLRDHEAEGRGKDRRDCMLQFKRAWERHCAQPGWLDEFLAMKRKRLR